MDKSHSLIIIVLLAGILFVMIAGRAAALELLGNAFWVVLVFAVIALIAMMILSVVRFSRREISQGRPWFFALIAYPAMFANFAVAGLAGVGYLSNSCATFHECLHDVPLWWLPICVFMFGIFVVQSLEKLVLRLQKRLSGNAQKL